MNISYFFFPRLYQNSKYAPFSRNCPSSTPYGSEELLIPGDSLVATGMDT